MGLLLLAGCAGNSFDEDAYVEWKANYESFDDDVSSAMDVNEESDINEVSEACGAALKVLAEDRDLIADPPDAMLKNLVAKWNDSTQELLETCSGGEQDLDDSLVRSNGRYQNQIDARIEQLDKELDDEGK